MTSSVVYKVGMSLTGRLSHLPDSQKIFGALVYLYAELYSSQEATALVAKVRDGEVYVSLSNMFPGDYLPVPHAYLLDRLREWNLGEEPENRIERKQIYQALKKRSYAPLEQISHMLEDPRQAVQAFPYVCIESTHHIHISIDSLRYDMPGLDSKVYSIPEIAVTEIRDSNSKPTMMTDFSFYIEMDDRSESTKIVEALQHAMERQRRFFLGPRTSQGLNTFVISRIRQERQDRVHQGGAYLNMGMLLPGKIDFDQSYIKLFTSERRPYHLPSCWDKKAFSRKFISFVDAGSIVYLTGDLTEAGRSIPSPYLKARDIVFGNAFLWPIQLDRRSEDGRTDQNS